MATDLSNATTWLEDIFGIAWHAELLPMDEEERSLLIGNDCNRRKNGGKVGRSYMERWTAFDWRKSILNFPFAPI